MALQLARAKPDLSLECLRCLKSFGFAVCYVSDVFYLVLFKVVCGSFRV